MTKKQRLAKLLKAAEDLQYDYVGWLYYGRFQKFSCEAVEDRLDSGCNTIERDLYNEAVAAHRSAVDLYDRYDEQSQLARQLAVLMYREGIKRGKYD